MRNWLYILIFGILLSLNSCKENLPNKQLVASTDSFFLFKDDLEKNQPEFKSSDDSLEWTTAFIDNWIKQHLILEKAKFNLPPEKLNFEAQLTEYENSLIKHQYEIALIKNFLDTVVTEEEVNTYYDQNKENFILLDYLIQAYFIVMDKEVSSKEQNKIKKMFQDRKKSDWVKLEKICIKNNAEFELFDSTWYKWEDFSKEFNLEVKRPASWLRNNDFIHYQDSIHSYMIRINNYQMKNEISPLRFEEKKIKQIILHKRKLELIKKMEQEIFEEGIEKGKFKRYQTKN